MAFSSLCSIKSVQPEFKVPYSVINREKSNQRDIPDSVKYTLTKKFLDLIEYQSTLLTPEEMECYYNEYSSKIVNKVIEKKVIRDNRGHFGSVCDPGEGCSSSVFNDIRMSNTDVRRNNFGVPSNKQNNGRKAVKESVKLPPTIEEELNGSVASRTRNYRNKNQQLEHRRDHNRARDPVKRSDNGREKFQDVNNKKSRELERQVELVADYSTNSSSFIFSTPTIPQKGARKTGDKQFKKPAISKGIHKKQKHQRQFVYNNNEDDSVSSDNNESDASDDINDLRLQ